MADIKEPLIPKIGVVTDIRIDTPDVKTFRVVTPDGKKAFDHAGAVRNAFNSRCGRGYVLNHIFPHKHRVYGIFHKEMRLRYRVAALYGGRAGNNHSRALRQTLPG